MMTMNFFNELPFGYIWYVLTEQLHSGHIHRAQWNCFVTCDKHHSFLVLGGNGSPSVSVQKNDQSLSMKKDVESHLENA